MFTGPVGPVEVFFYWPAAVLGNFYWPGAIGSPLASSPEYIYIYIYIYISGPDVNFRSNLPRRASEIQFSLALLQLSLALEKLYIIIL